MENDLISRSELVEKIKEFIPWFGKPEKVECANQIIELISHQPTVERPQGEWKSLMWVSGEVIGECPFCDGEQVAENYCSYCGARLHGIN